MSAAQTFEHPLLLQDVASSTASSVSAKIVTWHIQHMYVCVYIYIYIYACIYIYIHDRKLGLPTAT